MNNSLFAVFRFYASHWRGAGHAMRCMTLAEKLKGHGWNITFVTETESYDFVPQLNRYSRLEPEEFWNKPLYCDLLVIDHYDCDVHYERHFRDHAKTILVIDDLANRPHECDIIHDQTYGRKKSDYTALVPSSCHILTGTEYALVRDEFYTRRSSSLARRMTLDSIRNILINFGGNDQNNNILNTLKMLSKVGYHENIDIVYGLMAPHYETVELYAQNMKANVRSHVGADMATLSDKADLAIGAAGSSTWERCTLGLPSVLLQTADNQADIIKNLHEDEIIVGTSLERLEDSYLFYNFNPDLYRRYVLKSSSICDGLGTNRVYDSIQKTLSGTDQLPRKQVS